MDNKKNISSNTIQVPKKVVLTRENVLNKLVKNYCFSGGLSEDEREIVLKFEKLKKISPTAKDLFMIVNNKIDMMKEEIEKTNERTNRLYDKLDLIVDLIDIKK